MLSVTDYKLQYSAVDFNQVLADNPDVFITEGAPVAGTPQLTNAQVGQLAAAGTKVFGYVDSSVTDDGRPYWNPAWTSDGTDKGIPTALAPNWLKTGVTNPFGITCDIRDPAWKQIVIDQCVDLVQRGYSGIFLDDVAQYFILGLGLGNTDVWARAMLDLVTDVKDAIVAVNPNAELIINSTPYITSDALGGPTSAALISEFRSKVDAMMLEVFFGISFAPEESGIQQAVSEVAPYMTVLALEYGGTPHQNFLFMQQAEAVGFVAGVSRDESYSSYGAVIAGATELADVLQGTRRSDTIIAGGGNDKLFGSDGNDTMYGDAGNDILDGGRGADAMFGGSGTDTVTYAKALITGVTVNLLSGVGSGSEAAGDTYAQIENIIGTNFNDVLTLSNIAGRVDGRSGNDIINGGNGNDVFFGGAGADQINGGGGVDRAYYSSSTAVNINMLTNVSTGGEAQGDTFNSVEEISGSAFGDTIIGNGLKNRFFGQNGNDVLAGGTGADTLVGGAGSDTFVFAFGDSGTTATTLDTISDFAKGAVGTGDRIDFGAVLSVGGNNTSATSTQAAIDQTTGVASFATGSATTLADALADIAESFTAASDAAGEFALFRVNNRGDHYMLVSDGVAGLGANDVLIRLGTVANIGTIDLSGGDLTILT
jgi:Ca2+-binding RTX toxin-like protein/endo-alpha-1,4-polygalactosaminidase (GH114 family)